MLASADFCPESGDIAHFILDPKSREIIVACFDSCFNEPEELRYFLKQENRADGPGDQGRVPESPGPAQRQRQNRMVLFPTCTEGQPKPKRYRPIGPGLTTDFGDMFDGHEWKTNSRRKFDEDIQSSYFCMICLAWMHTTRQERRPHPRPG